MSVEDLAELDWPELVEAAEAYDGVTGHSPRRSGAKLWARAGWRRELIKFLFRWGSDAIDAYIEEVVAIGQEVGGSELAPAPAPGPQPPPAPAVVRGEEAAAETPAAAVQDWTAEMEQLWLTVGSLSAELAGDQALAQELQEKPEGVTAEAFEGAMAALRDDLQEELGALRAVAQGASDSAALTATALAALPPQDVGMGEEGGAADPPAPILAPPAAGAPLRRSSS